MAFNDLLLKALNKEKTERPPIWLMRQAGRYMAEYRAVREKVSFLELCKNPTLACEVTLQPIDILGVDAGILFSDILIPVEPMGVDLSFNPAPFISNPVRTQADVNKLKILNPEIDVPFVYETVKLLVSKLNVPLIGFSGAPFTLACYMVEGAGSKAFLELRKMMLNTPKVYADLMDKLTDSTILYLQKQIDYGCATVQIFDTWAGILPQDEYEKQVFPYVDRIVKTLKNAPVIYFAKDGAQYFNTIKNLNCAGIGLDWKTGILEADNKLGNKFCLQGNIDPAILFANKEAIKHYTEIAISEGKKATSHIFNLGHGIMPKTPVENVKYLVDLVKGLV